MRVLRVLEPGVYTTVQDAGRFGFQRFGVPVTGVMDQAAFRLANLLVSNPEEAAVLEMTVLGPRLEVLVELDLAVTGAEMPLVVNDQPAPLHASVRVRPGDVVRFKQVKAGCRAYLAVSGGLQTPLVMGSRSTYVGARLGGVAGRTLAKGDLLEGAPGRLLAKPRRLSAEDVPDLPRRITLRAVPGPQDFNFQEGLEVFFETEYAVSAKADRMGYRLEGPPVSVKPGAPASIISEPSLPGGVQIPPDGQPIILLLEQTVGGYSKIATVISPDLGRVAQAKPGDKVRFEKITLTAAHAAHREFRERLLRLSRVFG